MPTVIVIAYKIGGPYFTFKPFVEATASYDPASECEGLQATLNWGLQVSIGAKVPLLGYSSEAYGIYSVKKPITSGCVVYQNGHIQIEQV
jgi:hypothetical protein